MKRPRLSVTAGVLAVLLPLIGSDRAGTATVSVIGQQAGATPFISILTLSASDPGSMASVQFTITPKPGSTSRPISATYTGDYLASRGYRNLQTGIITVPVFGLYPNYTNTVSLNYVFNDGSSQQDSVTVITQPFTDPCGFSNPMFVQRRTGGTSLSYDFILIKSQCGADASPIIDTDGALRWAATISSSTKFRSAFFDNAIYLADVGLRRNELDGTVRILSSTYNTLGVTSFDHNVDYGRDGLILDSITKNNFESFNVEVDKTGKVLRTWDLAAIVSSAMLAGGDDPTQFVWPLSHTPNDWFHNNATAYRASDNSLIVSSREDFVIALDYDTGAIKWILGDPTKKWYQFPSLRQYALTVAPGSLAPDGQHAVSITHDDDLLLFDNGRASDNQSPAGVDRGYSTPRQYSLDFKGNVATEIWKY